MTGSFQWRVALILFGVLFLGVSDTQLVPPLLSSIAREFGTTPGRAGIIVTSYSLAAAGFALLAGTLSDRIGRKKVLAGGLTLFAASSFATYHVTTLDALVIVRTLTGFAAGTLSTCALSFAGDCYPYEQRGRAMGVISMAYFLAFIAAAPLSALIAPRWGWRTVFASFFVLAAAMLVVSLWKLPDIGGRGASGLPQLRLHFQKPERLAGIIAAFLTSGGLVGFLTYAGAWLTEERGVSLDRVALVFGISGVAAVAASPLSGWISDRVGKIRVIVAANIVLAAAFLVVARLDWGATLCVGIAVIGVAASARQAPLHALSTEIVDASVRGGYTAVRNAASQIGIAGVAAVSAYAFDTVGFAGVGALAAGLTALIPLTCIWLRER